MVPPAEASTPEGPVVVAIDGPAGAGKTTVAKAVAHALGLPLLDTGAIYRALAWWADEQGTPWEDASALGELAARLPIDFRPPATLGEPQRVFVGEREVTTQIRTPHISEGASRVSALPQVRDRLLGIQRSLARAGCVAEGRDMGTVVFPDTPWKFFLTADADARAERRHRELLARQGADAPSLAKVRADMERRDGRDRGRASAPLRAAEDALCLDSTALGVEEVVAAILERVRGAAGATSA